VRPSRALKQPTTSILAPVEDEAALVSAAQHDLSGFTALYDRYFPAIYRYLSSSVRTVPEAEDLTAQTFLAAIEALPHYHHRGHFSGWLFTIARNKARDYYRRRPPEEPLDKSHSDKTEDSLAQVIRSDEIQQLALLVGRLDEDDQELIRLRCVAELSFAEIGAALGRKEEAVKKNFYRLAARLQRQLGGES